MKLTALSSIFGLVLLCMQIEGSYADAETPAFSNTRPKILESLNNGQNLKIAIRHNSSEIVLVLVKNRQFENTYKVLTQDGNGNLVPSRKPVTCQYIGHVSGYDNSSQVVLNNCDGIRGKVQYGFKEFRIRPLNASDKDVAYHRSGFNEYHGDIAKHDEELKKRMENVHELYETPVYNEKTEFGNVELEDEQDKTEIRKKRLTSYTLNRTEIMKINGQKLERHFIKISMIIDKSQHEILGNDVQRSTDFAEDVVNNIYSKFIPYNVVPALVQLIIWTDSSPIPMPNNYTKVLDLTAKYREKVLLLQEPSDITILITGTRFLQRWTIGGAYTSGMCDSQRSANVNLDTKKGNDIPYLATLIAHEISHVLGIFHDTDEVDMNKHKTCDCPCRVTDFAYLPYDYEKPAFCGKDDRCIMYPSLNRDYSYFSLCSRRSLEQGLQEHRCLHEAPKHIVGATGPVCGNAIIEDGETCDCGSDEDCPFLDPCCEPGTCQLKSSSQCHTGYCCTEQCQFKPRGETCRHKLDEGCDLEEQCTGTESMCPLDTYKQDSRSCLDSQTNSGFCSNGECLTLDRQCKKVFGPVASVGDDDYFASNTYGYWNGNCGYGYVNQTSRRAQGFRKCAKKDTKCGLLSCKIREDDNQEARDYIRKIWGDIAYVTLSFRNIRSPDYKYQRGTIRLAPRPSEEEDDESEGLLDFGQVQENTSCGDGFLCLSNVCTEHKDPAQCPSNDGKECDGHGQCNNLNKCQCDVDWGNETCSEYLN